jgi:hypothetical protein
VRRSGGIGTELCFLGDVSRKGDAGGRCRNLKEMGILLI